MNILVYSIAASESGALTILNDFYDQVCLQKRKSIHWYFIISTPIIVEKENITVLRYPWVKKNWFYRLLFEYVYAPRIVKENSIDKIFTMTNTTIPFVKVPQIMYLHNSLPFAEHKFSITQDFKLWCYQRIIGKLIITSITKSKLVIVQTEWMKNVCKQIIPQNRIKVLYPIVDIKSIRQISNKVPAHNLFFYPAGPLLYKNHELIVEACKRLKEQEITDYKIIFTFRGDENKLAKTLINDVKKNNLKIDFIGKISRDEVFKYYSCSTLLFPSYIETFGMPLLEARLSNAIVCASECAFSKEILNNYENAYFFDYKNSFELSKLIKDIVYKKIPYVNVEPHLKQTPENIVELITAG